MSEKRMPPFQSENVHNKHFINRFKKIKRLRVWSFLIEHIIYNFYNLIWTNIINFEARLLFYVKKIKICSQTQKIMQLLLII